MVALLCALALVATACGDDDGAAPPTTTTTTTTTESTSTTVDPAGDPDDGAGPGEGSDPDDASWPVPEWSTIDPAAAGVDAETLDELAARAESAGSDCLVVSRDGQLVGEWYWNGTGPDSERESFSVTKSITSILVGIAQDQGHLDIDQPASDYIDEWVGTPSEDVTIRNLLSNDSGRFHSPESDYAQMAFAEPDKTAYAIGLGQAHEPGTVWVYNNAAIQVLEAVLERATGTGVGDFAEEYLFDPMGMDTTISTDQAGNTLTFMGAQMSCRDLTRFGLLSLRRGEWQGEQIVPAAFVDEATRPSTELNNGYGHLWWLYGTHPDDAAGDETDSSAYAALGLGGQYMVVVPEHDLVVSRLVQPEADGGGASVTEILPILFDDLVVD
ncbi:MAG: serine hydrolase [Acidimicrobiales bacterium]|nr:serine hydrolase [Acidimicrobiales bacterium]